MARDISRSASHAPATLEAPCAAARNMLVVRDALFRWYWSLERRIVPGLCSSQLVFADVLTALFVGRPVWLDLGCGRRPFPEWMPREEDRLLERVGWPVGVDRDLQSLRDHHAYRDKVLSGGEALPFKSGVFDVVSANMVVEHLEQPDLVLREIHRVLRPGGHFLFHTPNRRHWPLTLARLVPEFIKRWLIHLLEGRRPEDVFATHYRFNDPDQILHLATTAGFRVERLHLLSSSATTPMLGPLVLIELLWIRWLRRPSCAGLRSNIIGILRVHS